MKKLTLKILIMVLIICSGCYEFDFSNKKDNRLTPATLPAITNLDEPIFDDPISIEDLVAGNQRQTEELDKMYEIIAQKDKKINYLEKLVMQNQKAMTDILAENKSIKRDAKTIKSLITSLEPLPESSIEPYIQTMVESSNKIEDLSTTQPFDLMDVGPVDVLTEIGPVDLEPIQETNKYGDIRMIWLGGILGLLGLFLFVKCFFFKN